MDKKNIDKKSIAIKLLFIAIGVVLFFVLFSFSGKFDYSDPLTIVKLVGFAVYLLSGEWLIKKLFTRSAKYN